MNFTIRQLDHLVLRVADLQRSVDFYCGVLGCEIARRRDDLGMLHLRAGASMIDIVALDGEVGRRGGAAPGPEGRNLDHLCLRVDPFDGQALIDYLRGQGVELLGPVQTRFGAEGSGPSIYMRDPDGNVVELKGPPAE